VTRAAPVEFELRAMTPADLAAVAAIEAASFRVPWSEAAFRHELDIPFSRAYVAHPAGESGTIAGYVVLWLVADEIHLLDLAVDPRCRRAGVGDLLARRVVDEARTGKARLVTLEVAERNHAGRRLYERLGFAATLVRKNYYAPGEHALVMEWRSPATQ
jgi:[ribosomal protein S18]-alanine N-acetyltransferase